MNSLILRIGLGSPTGLCLRAKEILHLALSWPRLCEIVRPRVPQRLEPFRDNSRA